MTTLPTPTAATELPTAHQMLAASVVYRDSDHSYHVVEPCGEGCDDGRVPGAREGTTKNCPACKGSGHRRTRVPSVTTVLGELNKPALVQWAADQAADAVLRYFAAEIQPEYGFVKITHEDAGYLADYARAAHRKKRDEAAAAGTSVHDWIEQHHADIENAPIPDDAEVATAWQSFVNWYTASDYTIVEAERIVIDAKRRYVGRFDLLLEDRRGRLFLADIKTSNSVNVEHVLQCAAYAAAYRDETGRPIAGTIVIWCRKDGVPVHTVQRTAREYRADFRVFAALLGIYEHRKALGGHLRAITQQARSVADEMAGQLADLPF